MAFVFYFIITGLHALHMIVGLVVLSVQGLNATLDNNLRLTLRKKNIRFVAYNTRYLIPSWVQVPHLASHLLGRMTKMLPQEWQRVYGHPVYFAETFVDTTRHRGTCYRAANWVFMGRTTGRGKDDQTNRPNRTLKDVLGLPLIEGFRHRLQNA